MTIHLTEPKSAQSHSFLRTLGRSHETGYTLGAWYKNSLNGLLRQSNTSASESLPTSSEVNELGLGNIRAQRNDGLFGSLFEHNTLDDSGHEDVNIWCNVLG